MRLPWQRRADEERERRLAAEQRLAEARADWVTVNTHLAPLRYQKNLNGWTGVIDALFADRRGEQS